MDKIDAKRRSANMARIKAKNTEPELLLRKLLFTSGHRYRLHYNLKGKPDIVFLKKRVVVFVNGCFWHGHGCKVDHISKSNSSFWNSKIAKNKERDSLNTSILKNEGWKVVTIWECDIRKNTMKSSRNLFKVLSKSSISGSTIS